LALLSVIQPFLLIIFKKWLHDKHYCSFLKNRMSKKLFFCQLISFLFSQVGYSQNSKSIIASIKYKVNFTRNKQVVIDDICQLDIDKNKSYFYSLGELENLRRIQERVSKAESDANGINLGKTDSKDFLHDLCMFKILKDYGQKKAIFIQYIGRQYLGFVRDSLSDKRWKILKGISKINGLLCREAVMKKDTTVITAWFCSDIPFHDGPLAYYGLPGLIIKASSTSGFETNLISVTYNKDPKREIEIANYALVTEAQLMRAATNQKAAFKNGKIPNGDEAKQIPNGH